MQVSVVDKINVILQMIDRMIQNIDISKNAMLCL